MSRLKRFQILSTLIHARARGAPRTRAAVPLKTSLFSSFHSTIVSCPDNHQTIILENKVLQA